MLGSETFGLGLLMMFLLFGLPVSLFVAVIAGIWALQDRRSRPASTVRGGSASVRVSSAPRDCPQCGQRLQADWRHCPRCGARIEAR